MSKYTINLARTMAINYAAKYENSLLNKQFFVLYRDKYTGSLEFIEVVFLMRHYQHLTGLLLLDEQGSIAHGRAEYFYRKCLEKKLSLSEIAFKEDGTTPLKLDALPAIVGFTSITKIIGDSNERQPYLYVDKVAGGVNYCIGLRNDDEVAQYVPVSALKRDIRELTDTPSQVLAILERTYTDNAPYAKIRHVSKGLNLLNVNLPDEISKRISLKDYVPK